MAVTCMLRSSTAIERANAGNRQRSQKITLKACYGCRLRAQARFLKLSPAFADVRSRSTAVTHALRLQFRRRLSVWQSASAVTHKVESASVRVSAKYEKLASASAHLWSLITPGYSLGPVHPYTCNTTQRKCALKPRLTRN